jgi:hypothetical protein
MQRRGRSGACRRSLAPRRLRQDDQRAAVRELLELRAEEPVDRQPLGPLRVDQGFGLDGTGRERLAEALVLFPASLWRQRRERTWGFSVEGVRDPGIVPFALFLGAMLELVALPVYTALSRRFERAADRFSLDLTGDAKAYEAVHRGLAIANLTDLDPPRAYYLVFHSHPTAPERLAAGRTWSRKSEALEAV